MRYYKQDRQNKVACLGCAIANALIDNDPRTAEMAYKRIRDFQPRTEKGEISDIYSVDAVRYATAGRYDGKLILLRADNARGSVVASEALDERVRKGEIIPVKSIQDIKAIPPAVLFFGGVKEEGLVYHSTALVRLKEGLRIVDDGVLKTPQQIFESGWIVNCGALNIFKVY